MDSPSQSRRRQPKIKTIIDNTLNREEASRERTDGGGRHNVSKSKNLSDDESLPLSNKKKVTSRENKKRKRERENGDVAWDGEGKSGKSVSKIGVKVDDF